MQSICAIFSKNKYILILIPPYTDDILYATGLTIFLSKLLSIDNNKNERTLIQFYIQNKYLWGSGFLFRLTVANKKSGNGESSRWLHDHVSIHKFVLFYNWRTLYLALCLTQVQSYKALSCKDVCYKFSFFEQILFLIIYQTQE